ncbi:hypothetical protein IWX90DRAFT_145079 [Phyllosticta citrichinensis]|uniref:Uncharacterized protein n=1 Tax=Phyllosticta citrichinensis TaxID=1130410 RepID=A0ABR1XZ12_9PEZI
MDARLKFSPLSHSSIKNPLSLSRRRHASLLLRHVFAIYISCVVLSCVFVCRCRCRLILCTSCHLVSSALLSFATLISHLIHSSITILCIRASGIPHPLILCLYPSSCIYPDVCLYIRSSVRLSIGVTDSSPLLSRMTRQLTDQLAGWLAGNQTDVSTGQRGCGQTR